MLPVDGRMFGEFLNIQIGFTILLSIFGASGLIANDLRTGAILVYLSRPADPARLRRSASSASPSPSTSR